jgi:hypothetical protein
MLLLLYGWMGIIEQLLPEQSIPCYELTLERNITDCQNIWTMIGFLRFIASILLFEGSHGLVNFGTSPYFLSAALLNHKAQHAKLRSTVIHSTAVAGAAIRNEPKVFEVQSENSKFAFVKRLLLSYQHLHGDMLVPQSFIIPKNSSSWPSDMWGIRLGSIVHNLRSKRQYTEESGRKELLSLGFCFNARRPPYKSFKEALRFYKILHGDMEIANDFVVPADDGAWPEKLWGFELGPLAKATREGAFRSHRKDLLNIGFFREDNRLKGFARFRAALLEFEENYGNVLVPAPFVIPNDKNWSEEFWGMKLGSYVSNVRAMALYIDQVDELKELGFNYEQQVMSFTFETLKAALYEYQEIYGDMAVPLNFIVPLDGTQMTPDNTVSNNYWPEDTRGIRLGRTVSMIRYGRSYVEHKDELRKMGFDFTPRPKANYGNYELTKSLLLKYKEMYGNLDVDVKFTVPGDVPGWLSEWPQNMHGSKLGKLVSSIRSGKLFLGKKEELMSLGFEYDSDANDGYDILKAALQAFKDIYGDLNVPSQYVVPNKLKWPRLLWGMRLGDSVDSVRGGFSFTNRKSDLIGMGFDYNSRERYGYDVTKRALEIYKSLYGNMLVDNNFIVPSNSVIWSESMWGMELGRTVFNIRTGYSFRDKKEELQNLGFNFSRRQICEYIQFKNALSHFRDLYGDLLVPKRYVLPTDRVSQCEDMGGLNLGCMVGGARSGQKFGEYREELEHLGFDFNTQVKYNYSLTRRMLVHYKELYGDMEIPTKFKIPPDEHWPSEMWGQKLGSAATLIRYGSYPENRDDLLSIGFPFTERRKKFDYECVKVAVYKYRELTHGSVTVRRDFKIPEGSSWYPEETWGMPLGAIVARIRSGAKWQSKMSELLG